MATMVKEKRRDKKKIKERSNRELSPVAIEPPTLEELVHITETTSGIEASNNDTIESDTQVTEEAETSNISIEIIENTEETYREQIVETYVVKGESIAQSSSVVDRTEHINVSSQTAERLDTSNLTTREVTSTSFKGSYKELSSQLARIAIPDEVTQISEDREYELIHPDAYLNMQKESQETPFEHVGEDIMPSAPCFEEVPETIQYEEAVIECKPKVKCMALEDAIKLCGGVEMEEVRAMSEREEEIVEAGPMSGPEHPLVDLLSTFRSSLIAVERERIQLACGFAEEEKRRGSLWKIEKRHVNLSEKCPCGLDVTLKASYEYAELVKEKLPVAKLRLESLLRDVQDSYCHHQHAALLAHCQIEELISETVQSNKNVIREALSLILQALRLSDNAPQALASALQRWAAALSAALIDNRDLRQLLFLLHHLFRQSRSVQWAASVVHLNVDAASPWRVIALLSLLLARPRTDTALECTEDAEETWEEVDKHGGGGAVSEGTLRERDLLALLSAFPLRDLVARLVLFTHSDIRHARPNEWGDSVGGRGVVKACCGVRVLLHALHAGARAQPTYVRLQRALRELAARALHALACLHLTSRAFYAKELEEKISAELEASFSAGFALFETQQLDELPATLLADNTAKDYCISIIIGLHDTSPKQLELLSISLPALPCDVRVRIVSQAAIDRSQDHELARIVLEFLLQIGLKRKSVSCRGMCDVAARECLGRVLAAHAYLHTTALQILADLNIVESLDPSCVKTLIVDKWRPSCTEVQSLLDDWARRCHPLLQHLLLGLDYTPYVGLPLDVQLTIGSWLCSWVLSLTTSTPEWCWSVLRRLRVHRTCWNLPCDAPAPDSEPVDLFSIAYALMATSYGHCMPVICSEGVSALCKLAGARPRDAVQCLAGVMLVMAHSPESVAYTPKFTELFTILLSSGPTLMQRALGRGGAAGSELLLRLILAQLSDDSGAMASPGVLSAWLHACWRPQLAAAAALLDAAACATRLWPHLDAYANALLQEENAKDHINNAVRNAGTAPLLCECLLRACHAVREASTHLYARLLGVLHQQRLARQKIHVDNALQKIGAKITSEELVIYRAATAALAAPMNHPSHLTLWRLFMHLYLQMPPEFGSVPAIGPLFFSGLIKSRTLNQITRRLLETITYHHKEGETLKTEHKSIDTSVVTQSNIQVERATPVRGDDGFLPALSIVDLTGESSGSSDTEDNAEDSRSEKESSPSTDAVEAKKNLFHLITYHAAAEKLLNEYLSWLEQGEKVRIAPHFADIARYIPEHALEAAWKRAVCRPPPSELDSFPAVSVPPPPDNTPPLTPFHVAVNTILKIKDRSRRRRRRTLLKSPVEDVDFQDSRTLVSLVDKHLNDIEKLAQEWCGEVGRVSALDSRLWELVSVLRVRRALPPVRQHCANKCKPLTIYIPEQEWCISVDAERGIKENRSSARAAVRRLARARPHAASTAAALHTIARRTRSSEAGVRVVERAWRAAAAPHCAACAPASSVLTALVADLAERWISHSGRLSTELLSSWGRRAGSSLQQALCGALLAPRRLPPADWPKVYSALLDSQLPSHTVFSYLSKFEMSRWSESADPAQRRDMLEILIRAVQRGGPSPAEEHHMLVELLGVHSAQLIDARELCAHVLRCATAAVNNTLPPAHWTHVVKAVEAKAAAVPFDQIGHLLRELGVLWWEARSGVKGAPLALLAPHAPHVAALLRTLQRAFVAAAMRLSLEPERVAWYAWGALQEAWGAWLAPHARAPPLLPSTADDEAYTPMLRHFVDNVHQIMLDCPGSEVHLLQQLFEWAVQSYINVQSTAPTAPGASTQESRVQASALLAELAKLPWSEHQWFYGKCLQQAIQMSTTTERELSSWCCAAWRATLAPTLLRDCDAAELVPRLASLLYLFTGTHLPNSHLILDEASKLPWYRLPEPALDEALDRFFMLHHNPACPYHDLPQFRLILVACGLAAAESATYSSHSGPWRTARTRGVSQWVRGACAPALLSHVPAHSTHVLRTLTDLAPRLNETEGEVEELLSRAVIIMCMEPAASVALPVWVSWVSSSPPRLVRACVSAVATLTAFEYFATLADAAVRALLLSNESHGWHEVSVRWAQCPWRDAPPLAQRARLHAAYACALTHAHAPSATRATLSALLSAEIHFVDNEPIIALWICYACRIALTHSDASDESDETRECGAAARALLARWTEQPRRSILRVVTMHADTDKPTALTPRAEQLDKHRTTVYVELIALTYKMHSSTVWKLAAEPNYNTNIDQDFPYSDLPHQGEARLLKIPVSLNDLIRHVDYFGEGRIVSARGVSGFTNCYNVNHQYRLVSSGPDKDKKIPNRIPLVSYTDCDTSGYIKHNSVRTVTVAAERLNSSCAKDIARVVNNDLGTVLVFGAHEQTQGLVELATELKKKGMFPYINATLPNELQGLTLYDGHIAFLNNNDIRTRKDELYNNVVNGDYDSAVNTTRGFFITGLGENLDAIVQKLIREAPRNVVVFAYKLWHGGAKDVVRNHFPDQFQYIVSEDPVMIVNYAYNQALKLDSKTGTSNNDRAVWGDSRLPRTSSRLSWKILPVCQGNDLTFKLYNIDCDMYMRMDDQGVYDGDKHCWGSTTNEEDPNVDRFKYYFETEMVTDTDLVFLITNVHQKQRVKLEVAADKCGDRLAWGNNLNVHDDTKRNNHRLLCRYAQCILSPDDNTRRAYESACSAALGANNDVSSWAGSPQLDKLVRLAVRLWPKSEKYFQYEMEVAPAVGVECLARIVCCVGNVGHCLRPHGPRWGPRTWVEIERRND
ncbi:hypothetical protein PYW08_016074 [Mythimna loreyi]|uniref:Uncharacterized protein n=1 Tax=Mythimna loreyi TaxID=667449 RepID=A0ACC2QWR0_9NEOP|nr:hypothetical protein PYW08_016074 [Mythimna loreyi]